MTRRLFLAMLLLTSCSPVLAAQHWQFSRLLDVTAEGNFLKLYAQHLKQAGLEPLEGQAYESYRFEIVPAFSNAILIDVRVEKDGTAEATAYEMPSSLEPGPIPRTHKRLSRQQVRNFQRLLMQGEFWDRYHFGWGPGLDTWVWVFEGSRGNNYHVFSTSDPAPRQLESAGTMLFRAVMGREIPR